MNSLTHRSTRFLPGSCCIPQNTAHRLGSSKPFWSSLYSLSHPLWLREQPAANVAKHQHSQELENLDPSQCSPDPSWDAHLVNSLITGVLQPQVNHRVLQRPPHVEFQGEVINPLQEKNHPVVTFPRAGGDSRSCFWVTSQKQTGKKPQLSTELGVVCTRNFRVVAPVLLSCFFPNREEAV